MYSHNVWFLCSTLFLFQCSKCLHLKEFRSLLDFKLQNIFKDLFIQQSSLGVAFSGDSENRALMDLHLPMYLYSYKELLKNCSNLQSELDGYLFFASNISVIKTEIIQSLVCFNKTTLKLNTKKIVVVIKTSYNDLEYLNNFSWLWKNFGLLNLVLLFLNNNTKKPEFFTFNPFLNTTSKEGTVLRYFVPTEATNSFDQVLKNLRGHSLKVFLFSFPYGAHPAFFNDSKSISGGPDLTFMFTLQQFFNVNFEHHRPRDYQEFLRTGTANGTLTDLSNNCVDILINSKTVKFYKNDKIQFLFPRKFSNFVILVKKQGIITGWQIALYLLQGQVWICLILTFIACSVVYITVTRIRLGTSTSFDGVFIIMKAFLSVSVINTPQTHPERILITVCLMLSVVVTNLFFGQVFYLMKSQPQLPNINSLAELQNSDLPIFTAYYNFLHAFDGLKNTTLRKLPEKLEYKKLEDSTFGINSKNISDKYVILTSLGLLEMEMYLKGPEYFENIHVLKESIMFFSVAQLMPIGSIYFNQFNILAIKLCDHGLFYKWLKEYLLYRKKENLSTNQRNETIEPGKSGALDFEDLRFPFVIILIGFVLSLTVFIAEIVLQKIQNK